MAAPCWLSRWWMTVELKLLLGCNARARHCSTARIIKSIREIINPLHSRHQDGIRGGYWYLACYSVCAFVVVCGVVMRRSLCCVCQALMAVMFKQRRHKFFFPFLSLISQLNGILDKFPFILRACVGCCCCLLSNTQVGTCRWIHPLLLLLIKWKL